MPAAPAAAPRPAAAAPRLRGAHRPRRHPGRGEHAAERAALAAAGRRDRGGGRLGAVASYDAHIHDGVTGMVRMDLEASFA